MLCKKPSLINGNLCPCGQCMACRYNLRRKKTNRILLESQGHENNCFITLTYRDECLPRLQTGEPTLLIRDHQLFLKSLRRRLPPRSLRFYIVGEYGEITHRPHYHAALFGIGIDQAPLVHDSWDKGFVHVGHLEKESAQYIAGYVTKKMTSKNDQRLNGRQAEYARSSNRGGGMGISVLKDIAMQLNQMWGEFGLPQDVPGEIGGLPFDRYSKNKLRRFTGISDGKTPEAVLRRMWAERQVPNIQIQDAYRESNEKGYALQKKIIETAQQKVKNFEYRSNLRQKRRPL